MHPEPSEIESMLAKRDRFRRRLELQMSPEQRLERMMVLQAKAYKLLQSSPEGFKSFLRRNYRMRAARNASPG